MMPSPAAWIEFAILEEQAKDLRPRPLVIGNVAMTRQSGRPKGCPERPYGYRYPEQGAAGAAVARVARAVKYGRSIFLYGPAGTGKSELFRAMAHDLNMEFSLYPMNEQMDPALYLGKEAIVVDPATRQNVTTYVEGRLLQDIQGRVGLDGVRRPVMIVVDDIDKAPAESHEIFRHLLDGTRAVFIPEMGRSVPVMEGTLFVATANSRGRGDDTGYYTGISRAGMDESLLDRFHRFIAYDFLDVDEERQILAKKYPALAQKAPQALDCIMRTASTVRYMIRNQEVHFNFSHRRLEDWCRGVEELIQEAPDGKYRAEMVNKAAEDWLERYDHETRTAILERALRAHVRA